MVESKEKLNFRQITVALFGLLKVPKMAYLIPFALALLRSVINLISPYYSKMLIDFMGFDENFEEFLKILWILIILNIAGYGINILTQREFQRLGISTIYDLRRIIFTHLQKMSLNYYHRNKTGRIMAYLSNDAENVNGLVSSALINVVLQLIQLIGSFVFMLILSWKMTLLLSILMPILYFVSSRFAKEANKRYDELREQLTEVTGITQETMDGLRTIRLLRTEKSIQTKYKYAIEKEIHARTLIQKLWAIIIPFNNVFAYLCVGLAIIMGGYLYQQDIISLGVLFAFILYFQQFTGPLQSIAGFFSDIQNAIVGGQHIIEFLKTAPEIIDNENAIPYSNLNGEIEFKNVTFAYDAEPVLKQISVKIPANQRLAIVGPTGAGKTTFASLIPRFYDIQSGEIILDGRNIKDYTIQSIRNKIGIVLQDTYLFNESIMDNIRFGRRDAKDDEIIQICKQIGIDDFITKLSQGYHTKVGERGAILSVGQAQMIAIARTIIANPAILILDEATSSVDSFSELAIQNALDTLLKDRTSIIIAHRLSTIATANKIIVMDQGKIIEEGTHSELIKAHGMYKQLYDMQFTEILND